MESHGEFLFPTISTSILSELSFRQFDLIQSAPLIMQLAKLVLVVVDLREDKLGVISIGYDDDTFGSDEVGEWGYVDVKQG